MKDEKFELVLSFLVDHAPNVMGLQKRLFGNETELALCQCSRHV